MEVLLRSLYGTTAVMAVPGGNGGASAIPLRIGPTSRGTAEVLNMFKVAAVPPRRFAMLTVFRGTTAINDGTSAEPRRSWRYHFGLCRTNTAVAPRPRCDGDIMSAVLTICRGFTAINDETTAEHGDHGGGTAVYAVQAPQWHRTSVLPRVYEGLRARVV